MCLCISECLEVKKKKKTVGFNSDLKNNIKSLIFKKKINYYTFQTTLF